ncbi:MAG: hypothetical protein ABJC05_03880 [Pyrinomonadaceae bacterium]
METKRGKYDTNPLDGDVAKNADEDWGAAPSGAPTEEVKGATRDIGRTANEAARQNSTTDTPTRRFEDPQGSYPSVFIPPAYPSPRTYQPPAPYQPVQNIHAPPRVAQKPGDRTVPGLGLPEKWAMILPYCPFHIGAVAAVVELFLIPRSEVRARFHAAQGLALQLAILVIGFLFSMLSLITDSSIGSTIFSLGATAVLVISMIRVWRGEVHHIAPLSEAANWLDDRIKPRQ